MPSFQDYMTKNHPEVAIGSDKYEILSCVWDAAIQAAGQACDKVSGQAYSKFRGTDGGPLGGRGGQYDKGRIYGADECANAVRQLFPHLTAEPDNH